MLKKPKCMVSLLNVMSTLLSKSTPYIIGKGGNCGKKKDSVSPCVIVLPGGLCVLGDAVWQATLVLHEELHKEAALPVKPGTGAGLQ
jgi:hypothetical protein